MSEPPVSEERPEPPVEPETTPIPADQPRRRDRGPRSAFFVPLLTAIVGLMMGLVIGAAGVGLFAVIALHHRHHGPFHGPFHGDGRGHHWQDNRPVPGRPVGPGR